MKYAGSITILDDEGNQVFEQELTEDQIIETLLSAIPDADEVRAEPEPEIKRTPPALSQPTTKSEPKPCCGSKQKRHLKSCAGEGVIGTDDFEDGEEKPDVRSCCGASSHGRHKAGCDQAGQGKPNPNRRTVDQRQRFSEPTYKIIKDMLDEGRGVDEISSEKGLDLDEVRRTNLADDFEDYVAIA